MSYPSSAEGLIFFILARSYFTDGPPKNLPNRWCCVVATRPVLATWTTLFDSVILNNDVGRKVVHVCFSIGDDMSIGLALNKESKYKRSISHFGPTTLRSTIAYGLLR